MKKAILSLSLTVALSFVAVASPAIYVAMPVYNFGSIVEGLAVVHTFVLTNTGDEVLQISGVNATCGCTTTDLTAQSIEPGGSVDLDVLINTSGFSGTITKAITVYSNDPGMPLLSLRVTGQVDRLQAHHITASDAFYMLYLLVDLRPAEQYNAHHFLGAVNIQPEELVEKLAGVPLEAFIILYDADFELSDHAASDLHAAGFKSAFALVGGLNEWIHMQGMKFVTQADDDYELPPRISYEYPEGEAPPSHYMPVEDFNYLFYLCVDVRTPDEYAAGHIMGAINIPFDELEQQVALLPKNVLTLVYDESGSLGDEAALWMTNNGFASAHSIFHGLSEWIVQYGDRYLLTDAPQ